MAPPAKNTGGFARTGIALCTRLVVEVVGVCEKMGTFLDTLAAHAHADGGWGYQPGQPVHLEPTCLALLALSRKQAQYQQIIEQGRLALARCATPDGAYRLGRGREEAVWATALVLFVQSSLDFSEDEVKRTSARLLSIQDRTPDDPESAELVDIDCHLRGWPWAEGNFSWAEPTAWACLALRLAGMGKHERALEGMRLLLDRASDEGGINYGNRRILGRLTEPLPEPTALMLLALQGHDDHPRVTAALGYLQRQALSGDDLELLCWAKLALDAYREQPGIAETLPQLDERIRAAYAARRQIGWLRPAILREALTALALATEEGNYFRLGGGCLVAGTGSSCHRVPHHPAPSTHHRKKPFAERVPSAFRGLLLEGAGRLRPAPPAATVHIARATDYNSNLVDTLQRQFDSFRSRLPLSGKRVVLKPNLVEYHRYRVINTHPNVVAGVIELCRREGAAEVIVAEGPGHCRNVEHLVRASGLGDVLQHYDVPFIDLNHDEPVKTLNLGRLTGLEYLFLSRTVATAEVLISLPKLKTHHWAGATLSMKNLFGVLPGICYGWPKNELHWRGIDNSIADINLTRPPDLQIVDGIVGMEGDGPLNGTPKPLGALIMGTDPVAVDATCCRLMQLNPERIGYLVLAQRKRLGQLAETAIAQIGERIDKLAQSFETVPHLRPIIMGRSA
jgi:uncharacterized protein (DUF362 family)